MMLLLHQVLLLVLEKILVKKYKMKMKIEDKIIYKKLQYDSNREAPKIPSLLLN